MSYLQLKIEKKKQRKPEKALYKTVLKAAFESTCRSMEGDTNINHEPHRKTTTNPFESTVSADSMTQLPDWSANITKDEPTNSTATLANSIDKLTVQVTQLKEELKAKDDIIAQLHKHILYVETELPLQSKKRKYSGSQQAADSNKESNEQELNNLREENKLNNLREENERLKTRVDQLMQCQETEQAGSSGKNKQNQESKLVNLIDEKLGDGFNQIHSNLEKLISTKLEVILQQSKQEINHVTSYAAAVGNKSPAYNDKNLRDIMMETKNEELIEEAERKRRGKNIIIHGVEEKYWGSTGENEDKTFVKRLMTNLQIGSISADSVERLGPENTDSDRKKRPLKVTFKTEDEQQKILRNLRNLKGNHEYIGVSIKEDYTFNERQYIRTFVEKAKAMNALEETKMSDTVWRVRGTPKNGLTLKRFTKKKEVQGQNWPSTL